MPDTTHFDKILNATFIALFSISFILILTNISSITGKTIMSESTHIAQNCGKTIPPSIPCSDSNYGDCGDKYMRKLIQTPEGQTLCCCNPPPEIKIEA